MLAAGFVGALPVGCHRQALARIAGRSVTLKQCRLDVEPISRDFSLSYVGPCVCARPTTSRTAQSGPPKGPGNGKYYRGGRAVVVSV